MSLLSAAVLLSDNKQDGRLRTCGLRRVGAGVCTDLGRGSMAAVPHGRGAVIHGPLRPQCHRKGAWQEGHLPRVSHPAPPRSLSSSFMRTMPLILGKTPCPGPLSDGHQALACLQPMTLGNALCDLRPLASPVPSQERIPASIPHRIPRGTAPSAWNHRAGVPGLPSPCARTGGDRAEQGLRGHHRPTEAAGSLPLGPHGPTGRQLCALGWVGLAALTDTGSVS